MDMQERQLPQHLQIVLERFVAACQGDTRVIAAFLHGSYASGTADAYSDLDLGVITTDAAYEDFSAALAAFLSQLGEPLFLETFDLPNVVFFIYSNGTEGELTLGRAGDLQHLHRGSYQVLLDKTGVLAGVVFAGDEPAYADQIEVLRRLIAWFWHDASHFITAMGRGQLWWAQGQLEELRRVCVNLARLRHNFFAETVGYEKVEHALPIAELAPLQATYAPLEPRAMLQAGLVIIRLYQKLAQSLARTHNIPYPSDLERLMFTHLEQVCTAHAVHFSGASGGGPGVP